MPIAIFAPATAGSTPANSDPRTINVLSDYGATGNGTTNDAAAITSAVAALSPGKRLYFPPGSYRFATLNPANQAAIFLNGLSNISIVFADGAELLMDNLSAGAGTSHGISIKGACSNVRLIGARIRWATLPSSRSLGDGIHVLGYPKISGVTAGWSATTGTVSDLVVRDCEVIGAPQCGAIFMGCDRPRIKGFKVQTTKADGCHFNACRDPKVEGYQSDRPGDDGLAFVTYSGYSDGTLATDDAPTTGIYKTQDGPFPLLTVEGNDWANGNAEASGIQVRDGSANGIRLAGVFSGSIHGFSVSGCPVGGVIVDSGEVGGGFSWTYRTSMGCNVGDGEIEGCGIGIYSRVFNSNAASDATFWRNDVTFDGIKIRSCTNRNLRLEGSGSGQNTVIAGIKLKNIDAFNGDVSISSLREGQVYNVHVRNGNFQFFGQDNAITGALSTLARHDVTVDNCTVDGGIMLIQDVKGYTIGVIKSMNSPNSGIEVNHMVDSTIGRWITSLCHRSNSGLSRAFMLNKGVNVIIGGGTIYHDANLGGTFRSLEFGGGDATDIAGKGVDFGLINYTNTINQVGSNVVIQGGGFGPVDYIYRMRHLNGGEASPIWRYETASNGANWIAGAA